MYTSPIAIRLTQIQRDRLRAYVARVGTTESAVIRQAVELFLSAVTAEDRQTAINEIPF